jgi:hypothetical protein
MNKKYKNIKIYKNIFIKNIKMYQENDILFYSNYCKHSSKILQFLVKSNLTKNIKCYCIDNRKLNPKTNQMMIYVGEDNNRTAIPLPPNIHSVPSLLAVKKNYQLIQGDDIIQYFEPNVKEQLSSSNFGYGEPMGFSINNTGGSNIMSEQFTFYNSTPQELSAKGQGVNRQMYNYVSASQDASVIPTPPDTYKPDKLSGSVTIESLQHQRNSEVPQNQAPMVSYQTTL